jgi:hypothetical protein
LLIFLGDRALNRVLSILIFLLEYYFGIVNRSYISLLQFFDTTFWRRCHLLFFLCFAYILDELSFKFWIFKVLNKAWAVNLRQLHILNAKYSMRSEELFFAEISRVFSTHLLYLQLGMIKDGVLAKDIDIRYFKALLLKPIINWLVVEQLGKALSFLRERIVTFI